MSARRTLLAAIAIGTLAISVAPVVAAAEAGGTNVIFNPGFRDGLLGWRSVIVARGSNPGYARISARRARLRPTLKCDRAQARNPYLEIEVPGGAVGYVEQDIIVPVNPARLTFLTWAHLEPVRVTVSVVSGPVIHRLLSYRAPTLQASPSSCSGLKPVTESLDMASYAGEAIGLRIRATSQGNPGASVDFDRFSLEPR